MRRGDAIFSRVDQEMPFLGPRWQILARFPAQEVSADSLLKFESIEFLLGTFNLRDSRGIE
jgi:hypothetical protein